MTTKLQKINILKCWHAIEFFQPYDLPNSKVSFQITHKELNNAQDDVLPWLNDELIVSSTQDYRYELHLGVFDKNESILISQSCFDKAIKNNEILRNEINERLDSEGLTCFAKILLDTNGTPNFEEFSVSTLPWALGHLKNKSIEKITSQEFKSACKSLKEVLSRFFLHLKNHPKNKDMPTLCVEDILKLSEILYDWANFIPINAKKTSLDSVVFQLNCYPSRAGSKINRKDSFEQPDKNEMKQKGGEEELGSVLPILNSFYVGDIESAINAIYNDDANVALNQYLDEQPIKKQDLYTSDGLKLIIKNLHPSFMPSGRWPADSSHKMSLMQQFSINTAVQELKEGGILSVNGPPGTGKTTLLRDLVAHNVTERAKALSSFNCVDDTLDENGFLNKRLFGFEMVVASTNNSAVKNISKELPQISSLGREFKDIDYLKPVANQLAAKKSRENSNQACCYESLKEEMHCWGTIAAILGKKSNMEDFKNRFFFDKYFKADSKEETDRPDNYNFLNMWRWNKLSHVKSFNEIKNKFKAQLLKLNGYIHDCNEISKLLGEILTFKNEKFLNLNFSKNFSHIIAKNDVSIFLKDIDLEIIESTDRLSTEKLVCELILSRKIRFFQRLFKLKEYRLHQYQIMKAKLKIKKISERIDGFKKLKNKLNICTELLFKYKGIFLPSEDFDIKDATLQRNVFWQNAKINKLRSQLFVTSLDLHQSWLKEVLTKKTFRDNVFKISTLLNDPGKIKNPIKLWRFLFMMVPVVSTTLASLSRMFSGVKNNEIGLLMIDESGQAIPQAAVGGILRAKSVLVVGDPLQIEPVMTTPPDICNEICKDRLGVIEKKWNPQQFSLQQIADRANRYGCNISVLEEKIWIGIPLWVHRRCIEPMFSLANALAYNNRMVHGRNLEDIISQPLKNGQENYWLDSKGKCIDNQSKTDLINDTEKLVESIISANHELSSIYIISPFKSVSASLRNTFKNISFIKNIGTVHTFQGKENDIVILVLGCCPDNQGGAYWASSKPNLLNVAITRAKYNLFVVGDLEVWGNKPYFSNVARKLKTYPARKLQPFPS